MTSPAAVAFLYMLICLIWGSTWLAIKIGLDGVPPFLAAGVRFSIAASLLFAWLRYKRKKISFDEDGRISLYSCAFLSFTFGYAVTYWAELYISSGLTAILWCTLPLCTALLSRFWTKSETLTTRKLVGIGAGMAGTAALFWTSARFDSRQAVAMVAALSGVVAAAINVVTVKKHGRSTDVLAMNACAMGIGAVCLLGLSLLFDSYAALQWRLPNVLALIYLALAGTIVTFVSYYHLLKLMDATRLSFVSLVYPIIALLIGSSFGGEKVTGASVAAIAVVLAGVAVAVVPRDAR